VYGASAIPDDPALPSLLGMSTAATTTDLYSHLDTVVPSPTARALLARLALQVRVLRRPVTVVVTGFWPESCIEVNEQGRCANWQSAKYADRASLRGAQAVKAVLAENGIPPNCIYTEGKGQRDPLTPLPPDYRTSPLRDFNRWVAINRRIQVDIIVSNDGCRM